MWYQISQSVVDLPRESKRCHSGPRRCQSARHLATKFLHDGALHSLARFHVSSEVFREASQIRCEVFQRLFPLCNLMHTTKARVSLVPLEEW